MVAFDWASTSLQVFEIVPSLDFWFCAIHSICPSFLNYVWLLAIRFSNVDCVASVTLYNKGPLALKEKHPTPRLQIPPFLADYGFIFQQTLSISYEHFR